VTKKIPFISNKIPGYILEQYPNFVLFVKGYYEWFSSSDRPYAVLSQHLDRLSFAESLDEYTEHLKNKYLKTIPQDVLASKETMIQWSKKFWQSKGSLYSYQFLFNIMFSTDVDIYLPKNDIFRLSDGKWVDDESVIFVTPTYGVAEDAFLYRKIKQTRQVYTNEYETATANVQRIAIRTYGGYKLHQLYLSNVKGTFKSGYTIENDDGDTANLMSIASGYTINNGGTNFQEDDILYGTNVPSTYDMTYTVSTTDTTNQYIDTKIQTILRAQDLVFKKNGDVFTPTYDGQYIKYTGIAFGDVITVTFPTYIGLTTVAAVDVSTITKLNILDPIIGNFDSVTLNYSNGGTGADITINFDVLSEHEGYYKNNDGFLSADRYLQDSLYYQDYSYVLRSEIDISRYRDIVKQTVHPAGMKMFGMVSISDVINMIAEISESIDILPNIKTYLPKFRQGPNMSLLDKLKATLDEELWRPRQYKEVPCVFWIGDSNYNLYDYRMHVKGLFTDAQRQPSNLRGWMTSDNFADMTITTSRLLGYLREDYIADDYFE